MAKKENKREIRTLNFGPGLIDATLREEKTATIRKYREDAHRFKKGEYFVGNFSEGVLLLLRATADTLVVQLGELTDADAQESGYFDKTEAFVGLLKYYPDLTAVSVIGIIHYEIPKVRGVKTIKIKKE